MSEIPMATVELHDLKVYQLAMRVGEDVWSLTAGWDWLAKQTIGVHWIRSADSIAASIAESHGRCSEKDGVHFYSDALAHLSQTQTWLEKVMARKLVPDPVARELSEKLESLRCLLNHHLGSIKQSPFGIVPPSTRGDSIHLLPLEEFFYPHSSGWNA